MKHQLNFSFEIGPSIKDIKDLQEVLYDIIFGVVQSFGAKIMHGEPYASHVVIQAQSRLDLFKITLKLKEFFVSHMQFFDKKYRAVSGKHTHLTGEYLLYHYQIEKTKKESMTIMRDQEAIRHAKAISIGNTTHIE